MSNTMSTPQLSNLTSLAVQFVVLMILFQSSNVESFEFHLDKTTLPGPTFPLTGLALFDEQTKGWRILGHPFVLKFQIRCLLMGAPCDVIGRWLKPRIEKILLEQTCEVCTDNQFQKVNEWAALFIEKHPALWRAAMTKYAENLGIPIPSDERKKMIQILGTYP